MGKGQTVLTDFRSGTPSDKRKASDSILNNLINGMSEDSHIVGLVFTIKLIIQLSVHFFVLHNMLPLNEMIRER